MQTVINNYITNSTVVGSTIMQGFNECQNVNVSNVAQVGCVNSFTAEVFRIFCGLDMKHQVKALSYLYELESMAALPAVV